MKPRNVEESGRLRTEYGTPSREVYPDAFWYCCAAFAVAAGLGIMLVAGWVAWG